MAKNADPILDPHSDPMILLVGSSGGKRSRFLLIRSILVGGAGHGVPGQAGHIPGPAPGEECRRGQG